MFLRNTVFFLLFCSIPAFSQDFSIGSIPDSLTANADAVVRLMQKDIAIDGRSSMTINTVRAVTVFNEAGLDDINAYEMFSDSRKIKSISAFIYDSFGNEIKKIKERDFTDHSATGDEIISDSRVLFLDYTPVQYPFTVVFKSEVKTSNTAFIPQWVPMDDYYLSVQKSVLHITYPDGLGFKYKAYNLDGPGISKEELANSLTLSMENKTALKREDYSPDIISMVPNAFFGLDKFDLEGIDGEAESWSAFGSWMYNSLLTGTDELPEETIAKIKSLTANETDPLKKAKIVYQYMQGKTHYISIQLGIGGWKPMKAEDVDRLGYGDCKALTNYTRTLLKAAGVDSYYTVIYGGDDKRDIKKDFVSMQGNHIILAIPAKKDYVWLECTSQIHPFGFEGDFTDDRDALVLKPGGGEIVHTHIYKTKDNTQASEGSYTITNDGNITGAVKIVSQGVQYDNKFYIETKSSDELNKYYKSYFSNINNLKLEKKELTNDKDNKKFTETLAITAESYCSKSGSRYMFPVNAFNKSTTIPQRYRHRTNPFEISRGYYDTDEITINLPQDFKVEAKPENVTITDKFGEYKAEYTMINPHQMLYKRSLLINNGVYGKDDYEKYRDFREKIARNDNAKMVLVKI